MQLLHFFIVLLAIPAALVSAAVPSSKRFDLTKPSFDLFRNKKLKDATVQQSFTFDNTNRRLFVVQRRNGASTTSGDLTITQLDFNGNIKGHMYLKGFGHGVSIAAQPVGSTTYLWTEVDANSNGYGTKLARFKFSSGTTLSKTSSSLTKFAPISGATEYTPAIDPINSRLLVRYHKSGAKHFALYDLGAATKGNFSKPLASFAHPKGLKTKSSTFQGYAPYGRYLYLLYGDSYEAAPKGELNSELVTVDMNTGKVVQGPTLTKAGSTLKFREPEGLAVYRTAAGQTRLFMGFASGNSGDRRSNLFYKNVTIS
jgi:hypothetical protein